ncbi:MAG: glycine cleavage system aminomethyltransferase GcvT [Actinomycetaceae bacterium]|nr:glycine cleavage system aminomethyltransferase GcvT [Actinomycetaceae bacterium]
MEGLLSTALESTHIGLGAKMTPFGGWNMPLRYTSDREEHEAVRTDVGKFDLSHMGQVEIEGPQAAAVLDYSLCIRPSKMTLGRARYSMILTAEGGIIDDLIVYRLGDERFLAVPNAANRTVVVDELTARGRAWCAATGASEEHSITDRTLERSIIAVQGPRSLEKVAALLEGEDAQRLRELGYYRALEVEIGGVMAVVARTGYTGETGYEIMLPASAATEVWERVDAKPCGLSSRDTLRLEAGMPLYGNELGLDVTPVETGAARLVGPHEFVGSQALAQREQAWDLYGLVGEGRRASRAGNAVFVDGQESGVITSGVLSPSLGYPVALARLKPGIDVGAEVEVDVRGTRQPMRVVELPFYSRPKS